MVVVFIAVLTFVAERSFSSRPLETLNNGVFDSVKQTLVLLETKSKHLLMDVTFMNTYVRKFNRTEPRAYVQLPRSILRTKNALTVVL